jgi:eukaryotic-like serine/threonine-protein kinase
MSHVTPGARLGPYQLVASLGAGGMGEVFKANDTRLDRTVAIKVLPAHLASDPEAKARFEREAKAIAALNHPHICTLHDVGQADGTDFLVMELVEGETLATRLERGPLPLDHALKTAIEIADGLDKAHRAGIVHRDLKPSNVMLTRSGAKLLDFGLAKQTLQPAVTGVSIAATQAPITGAGMILGSLNYMSPEQVEGREADHRSDIFSFGCVLYEMVTGRKAFEGASAASVVAAILEREPPSAAAVQPVIPARLDALLDLALAKSPEERWQSAYDLKHELQWLRLHPAGQLPQNVARRGRVAALLVVAVAATALITWFGAQRFGERTPQQELRFAIAAAGTWPNGGSQPALSSDGRYLAVLERPGRLWVHDLVRGTRSEIRSPAAQYPFWAPDAAQVGFFSGGKLHVVLATETTPREVLSVPGEPLGGAWSTRGKVLIATSQEPFFFVTNDRGEALQPLRLSLPPNASPRFPVFLDTEKFVYFDQGALFAASLGGGEVRRLTHAESRAAFASGHLVFVRDRALTAAPIDIAALALGQPVKEARDDRVSFAPSRPFTVSETGMLIYQPVSAVVASRLLWVDRTGRASEAPVPEANYINPTLAPDDTRVAFGRRPLEEGSQHDLWVSDLAKGTSLRLTFDAINDFLPVWSPDGRRLAYASQRGGVMTPYLVNADGTGGAQLLIAARESVVPTDWSRDGQRILYTINRDLYYGPPTPGAAPVKYLGSPFAEHHARLSPDMRWVAYQSDESGRPEIYVRPFPDVDAAKWQVSTSGGAEPVWRGRELFFVDPEHRFWSVQYAATGNAFEAEPPRALFQTQMDGGVFNYSVSSDGKRFLVSQTPRPEGSTPLTVVIGWLPPDRAR